MAEIIRSFQEEPNNTEVNQQDLAVNKKREVGHAEVQQEEKKKINTLKKEVEVLRHEKQALLLEDMYKKSQFFNSDDPSFTVDLIVEVMYKNPDTAKYFTPDLHNKPSTALMELFIQHGYMLHDLDIKGTRLGKIEKQDLLNPLQYPVLLDFFHKFPRDVVNTSVNAIYIEEKTSMPAEGVTGSGDFIVSEKSLERLYRFLDQKDVGYENYKQGMIRNELVHSVFRSYEKKYGTQSLNVFEDYQLPQGIPSIPGTVNYESGKVTQVAYVEEFASSAVDFKESPLHFCEVLIQSSQALNGDPHAYTKQIFEFMVNKKSKELGVNGEGIRNALMMLDGNADIRKRIKLIREEIYQPLYKTGKLQQMQSEIYELGKNMMMYLASKANTYFI